MSRSSAPIILQQAAGLIGSIVHVACGYYILRGRKLARLVFLLYVPVQLLISMATDPFIIPKMFFVLKFLIAGFFLFQPKAQAFFDK